MVTTKANCVTSGAVIWFCRKTAWTKLIICGLQMPKFTMIQSVMSLLCEFGLLTKYCTSIALLNDANCCSFSCVRWAANTQAKKIECVDLFV